MQKIYNLIKLDIRHGAHFKNILIVLGFALIYSNWGISINDGNHIERNTGDVLIFLFGGIDIENTDIISYMNWFGYQVVILYILFKFTYFHFEESKNLILPRVGNKIKWATTNIILIFVRTCIYIAIIYIVSIIICTFKIGIEKDIIANDFNGLRQNLNLISVMGELFLLNLSVIFSIVIINLNVYLFTNDFVKSTIATISGYFIFMFVKSKISIGIVAMFHTNTKFINGLYGLKYSYSLIYFLVLIAINIIVFFNIIKQK